MLAVHLVTNVADDITLGIEPREHLRASDQRCRRRQRRLSVE